MADTLSKPERHPSTAIPAEVIAEISYRLYLRRLIPPMTPEQSRATVRRNPAGKIVGDDAMRHANSRAYDGLTRDYARVLFDMGLMVMPNAGNTP